MKVASSSNILGTVYATRSHLSLASETVVAFMRTNSRLGRIKKKVGPKYAMYSTIYKPPVTVCCDRTKIVIY
jgi:hypothetical protein